MPGKDVDSGSDWDSIVVPVEGSRGAPPPTNSTNSNNQKTAPKPDDPPFDFRTKVPQAASSPERETARPGKPKKGVTYDPPAGYRSSDDSADENPIYARVLPKKAPTGQRAQNSQKPLRHPAKENDSNMATAVVPSPRVRSLTQPTLSPTLSPSPLPRRGRESSNHNGPSHAALDFNVASDEGLVNDAYEPGEDATQYPDLHWPSVGKEVPPTGVASSIAPELNRQMISSEAHPPDNVAADLEAAVDTVLTTSCIWVALPFKFVALILHHVIRLILVRILKPLLLDSVSLINDLLLSPIFKGVLTPLLSSIALVLTEAGNASTAFISPVLHLLRAFRLVEINYTSDNTPQSPQIPNVTNLLQNV